jgi:outer membrane biosynthesis protein TonB
MLAAAACGDAGRAPAVQGNSIAGGGVTVELPEPAPELVKAPPAKPKPATIAEPSQPAAADRAPAPKVAEKKAPPEAPEPEQPVLPEERPAAEADDSPAASPSDKPPLPNAVMARTLDRIGFRCGSVTSIVRIEGSDDPSAYRVACSSGKSYRASAKTGRYRFSELKGGE